MKTHKKNNRLILIPHTTQQQQWYTSLNTNTTDNRPMNTITDIFKDKGVVNAIALTKNYKRRTPPPPVEHDASRAYAFIAVTVFAGLIYCFLSTPSHQEITQDTRHTAKKTKKSKKSKKSQETKETKEQIQEKKLENYHVLSKRLIHPHQEHTLEELYFWKQVFEYLDPQLNQQRELRFLCCLFRDSIPPPPLWTSCPTHNNLDELFNRLQQVFNEDRTKVPKMVVLTADHYIINNNSRNSLERYVEIGFPIALIGKGINNTIIEYGGFKIQDATIKSTKLTREKVVLKDLSIDYATGNGVLFHNHTNKLELEMERVKITNCNKNGLWMKSGRANLIDCVIEKNKLNGIYAGSTATRMGSNVFVVLSGPATKIRVHKNGWYGSKTRDSSCAIKVKYPLTITKCFGITNDQDAVVKKSSGLKPDCWSCNSQGKKIKGYERHNYSDMKVECSECDGTGTIGKPFGGPGSLFESRARLCGLLNKNEWNGLEVEVDEWNNKKERHLVYIKQIEGTAGTSNIQAYIKLENLKFLRVHTRKVESYSSHNPCIT